MTSNDEDEVDYGFENLDGYSPEDARIASETSRVNYAVNTAVVETEIEPEVEPEVSATEHPAASDEVPEDENQDANVPPAIVISDARQQVQVQDGNTATGDNSSAALVVVEADGSNQHQIHDDTAAVESGDQLTQVTVNEEEATPGPAVPKNVRPAGTKGRRFSKDVGRKNGPPLSIPIPKSNLFQKLRGLRRRVENGVAVDPRTTPPKPSSLRKSKSAEDLSSPESATSSRSSESSTSSKRSASLSPTYNRPMSIKAGVAFTFETEGESDGIVSPIGTGGDGNSIVDAAKVSPMYKPAGKDWADEDDDDDFRASISTDLSGLGILELGSITQSSIGSKSITIQDGAAQTSDESPLEQTSPQTSRPTTPNTPKINNSTSNKDESQDVEEAPEDLWTTAPERQNANTDAAPGLSLSLPIRTKAATGSAEGKADASTQTTNTSDQDQLENITVQFRKSLINTDVFEKTSKRYRFERDKLREELKENRIQVAKAEKVRDLYKNFADKQNELAECERQRREDPSHVSEAELLKIISQLELELELATTMDLRGDSGDATKPQDRSSEAQTICDGHLERIKNLAEQVKDCERRALDAEGEVRGLRDRLHQEQSLCEGHVERIKELEKEPKHMTRDRDDDSDDFMTSGPHSARILEQALMRSRETIKDLEAKVDNYKQRTDDAEGELADVKYQYGLTEPPCVKHLRKIQELQVRVADGDKRHNEHIEAQEKIINKHLVTIKDLNNVIANYEADEDPIEGQESVRYLKRQVEALKNELFDVTMLQSQDKPEAGVATSSSPTKDSQNVKPGATGSKTDLSDKEAAFERDMAAATHASLVEHFAPPSSTPRSPSGSRAPRTESPAALPQRMRSTTPVGTRVPLDSMINSSPEIHLPAPPANETAEKRALRARRRAREMGIRGGARFRAGEVRLRKARGIEGIEEANEWTDRQDKLKEIIPSWTGAYYFDREQRERIVKQMLTSAA